MSLKLDLKVVPSQAVKSSLLNRLTQISEHTALRGKLVMLCPLHAH